MSEARGIAARWRALVALLDRREDGLTLALVRILAGTTIALHLLHLSSVGAVDLVWVDKAYGGVRGLNGTVVGWLGGATPGVIHGLVAFTVVAAVALATGTFTRVAAVATWAGFRVLADLNSHAGGSYDELLSNVLFLLILGDAGARLSVDALRRPPRLVTAWPRWLLVLQLVVMYTSTGLQKVSDHWVVWGSHDALWYILQQPTWQRAPMEWVAPAMPLLSAASAGVWCFEVGAPVLLLAFWYRLTPERPGRLRAAFNRYDARAWFLGVGFFMHAGIEASMEVGAFFPATMTLYLAAFSPDEWGRALRRVLPPGATPARPR